MLQASNVAAYEHYFMEHHQGPIIMALGTAYTAGNQLDDVIYTNPAAMTSLSFKHLSFYSLSIIEADLLGINMVFPNSIPYFSFGFGYKSFLLDGFKPNYLKDGYLVSQSGEVVYKAEIFSLSLARDISQNLSVGWTGSYYREHFFSRYQRAMISHFAFLYRDFYRMNVGLSLNQLFSPSVTWARQGYNNLLESVIKIGFSYPISDQHIVYGDVNLKDAGYSFGFQKEVFSFLHLYLGYKKNKSAYYSCGFSVEFSLFSVSISYMPYVNDLKDQTFNFSFSFR